MSLPPIEELIDRSLDVTAPESLVLEFQTSPATGMLVTYVHIEGVTLLRACRVREIVLKIGSASRDLVLLPGGKSEWRDSGDDH